MSATCLCTSTAASLVQQGVRHDPDGSVYRCSQCELVYVWPRPTAAELDRYYLGPYRRDYPMVPEAELARDSGRRVAALLPFLDPSSTRLADVGSGSGAFLDAVRPHVHEAVGVEPDAGESIARLAGEFEVVTLFHVLEHVHDPVAFVRNLVPLLRPRGRLVVEVPNVDDALLSVYGIPGFRAFYFMSAHLWYFSPTTLANVLEAAALSARVTQVQRYDLSNHLTWMQTGRPGGFGAFPFLADVDGSYAAALVAAGVADTLWAVAERVE